MFFSMLQITQTEKIVPLSQDEIDYHKKEYDKFYRLADQSEKGSDFEKRYQHGLEYHAKIIRKGTKKIFEVSKT